MTTNDRYFRARATRVDQRRRREGRSVSEYRHISFQSDPSNRAINDESRHLTRMTRLTNRNTRPQVVMSAFGVGGYALVCVYFVVGSAVTKVKMKQKQEEGIAEARGGFRGPGSVWGSGTAGILCALAAITGCTPVPEHLWRLGFVASFCSKLSDTTASEIGKAYGKTTYMSTPPFKIVPRGTEGAVSAEGAGAGIVISALFAFLAVSIGQLAGFVEVGVCVVAAFVATSFESMLGAVVQGKKGFDWLTNDVVNGIQITLASVIAVVLGKAITM